MVTDVEFGNLSRHVDTGIGTTPRPLQWPDRIRRKSRTEAAEAADSLEDEIANLRRQMEVAFEQCDSLTSEPVMEISRMLDVKINEYMKVTQKD
ncbi:aspartyl-phosphate phosphatase Spo0E family protein [Paenibacillus mesophilus]|uniref:aspartyl-phosphate phosphatase Spo0E family protein n=1 Tax=Paenibacillus mesophilus TaxID=2582849 RepID=UPI00110E7E60|nr:aspartyl-phosphate phosphatase Spo0E family protein [Paenibacillus mesophilus]